MTKPSVPVFVAGALALLCGGCPLVSIEAELEEACVTRSGIEVEGAPVAGTISKHYDVDDLSGLTDLVELDADLQFVRFEAHATSGITELGAIDAAHVTVASGDPDSTLPTLVAYDCDGNCPVDGASLEVPAATDRGAGDYIASGSLSVDVDVTGALPDHAWTMDVSVCVKGKLAYEL